MRDVTDHNFEREVILRSFERAVLVDFWSPGCGPCQALAPLLEAAQGELAGRASIVKLDVDANRASAERHGVQTVPTLILFGNGRVLGRWTGNPGSREALLSRVRGVLG